MLLVPEAVAVAVKVELVRLQVIVLEEAALTVGVDRSEATVTEAVEVHPLDWVTVTV
jgi:hypothetical protein